jgi:hypothetical protein
VHEPRDERFTMEEVVEALDGIVETEVAANALKVYLERKQADEVELAKMKRIIAIIDEYDEVILLDREGGNTISPDRIVSASRDYLSHSQGRNSVDELDQDVYHSATYILKAVGRDAKLADELRKEESLFNKIKRELLERGFVLKLT